MSQEMGGKRIEGNVVTVVILLALQSSLRKEVKWPTPVMSVSSFSLWV